MGFLLGTRPLGAGRLLEPHQAPIRLTRGYAAPIRVALCRTRVVNLVPLTVPRLPASATTADIERTVVQRLILPCLLSKIAANRMALVYKEGLIVNVAMLVPPVASPAQAFASVVKAAMTAMTRAQAEEWAGKAIRFNAIAPQTAHPSAEPSLAGEPEVAALALYLASGRGKALSGHVFEAEPAR